MTSDPIPKEVEQRLKYDRTHQLAAMLEETTTPWLAVLLEAAAEIRRRKAAILATRCEPVGKAVADSAETMAHAAGLIWSTCSQEVCETHRDMPSHVADEWAEENPDWPRRQPAETPTDTEKP